MIYFVRATDCEAIKIGYTGTDPELRMASLQTGSPSLLTMVGWIQGGVETERALHKRFGRLRIRGEWFTATDELMTEVREILAGKSVAVPAECRGERWVRFDFPRGLVWPAWVTPCRPVRWGMVDRKTFRVYLDGSFVGLSPLYDSWVQMGYSPDEMVKTEEGPLLFTVPSLLAHANGMPASMAQKDGTTATVLHAAEDYAAHAYGLPTPTRCGCECVLCYTATQGATS